MTQRCLSRATHDARHSRVTAALCCGTLALLVLVAGCGSGMTAQLPRATPVAAPAIVQQPTAQSVPMGRSASYSIHASGDSLRYQWSKNGAPVSGALDSSYTTAPVAFGDSGATFTVTVTNAGGSVTSSPASLTVTARAPQQGDLRFQQVDADSTVNGYGNAGIGLSTDLVGRMTRTFGSALGTPLYVGPGACGDPPVADECFWFFSVEPLAASTRTFVYASDFNDSFSDDLQGGGSLDINGLTPTSSHAVITSLDLEPASDLFALVWVQDSAHDGFTAVQQTVALADLPAAAAAEGAASRVITAISHFAYAWQSDTATLYETQIASGSVVAAPVLAADLAAKGYIITASGVANDSGDVLLVGTRVQGDTLARPFVAAQESDQVRAMRTQGYATVGVIFNTAGTTRPYTYLGER
jgi:hypothetical protein